MGWGDKVVDGLTDSQILRMVTSMEDMLREKDIDIRTKKGNILEEMLRWDWVDWQWLKEGR